MDIEFPNLPRYQHTETLVQVAEQHADFFVRNEVLVQFEWVWRPVNHLPLRRYAYHMAVNRAAMLDAGMATSLIDMIAARAGVSFRFWEQFQKPDLIHFEPFPRLSKLLKLTRDFHTGKLAR